MRVCIFCYSHSSAATATSEEFDTLFTKAIGIPLWGMWNTERPRILCTLRAAFQLSVRCSCNLENTWILIHGCLRHTSRGDDVILNVVGQSSFDNRLKDSLLGISNRKFHRHWPLFPEWRKFHRNSM